MNKKEIANTLLEAEKEFGLLPVLYRVFGKTFKVRLDFSESICKASIDELSLSVRSHNALRRAGIATLGDLIAILNEGNLKSVRNLGAKSYSEIQSTMLHFGYDRLSDNEKIRFFTELVDDNT